MIKHLSMVAVLVSSFEAASGVDVAETSTPSEARLDAASTRPSAAVMLGAGELVWQRFNAGERYTRSRISIPRRRIIASAEGGLVEGLRIDGPPEPEWAVFGGDYEVAVSTNNDVVVGFERPTLHEVRIHRWDALFSEPAWTFDASPARPPTWDTVVVSRDGSTIGLLVQKESVARMYVFDADSPEWVDTRAGTPLYPSRIAISDDGMVVTFSTHTHLYVLRRDTGAFWRLSEDGVSPFALSGDGSRIVYAATDVGGAQSAFWITLRQWNGTAYERVFFRGRSGFSIYGLAMDAAGETLVAGRMNGLRDRAYIDLYDLSVATEPAWTYEYLPGQGVYSVSRIAITADGAYVAVSTRSAAGNPNPEVHVFGRAAPEPLFTLDTPGSMLDVDIARAPGGVIHIAAAGEAPLGGDLYSMRLETACTSDVDGDAVVGFGDLLTILGAWGAYDPCPPFVVSDLDHSCDVGFGDLVTVLAMWGPCEE